MAYLTPLVNSCQRETRKIKEAVFRLPLYSFRRGPSEHAKIFGRPENSQDWFAEYRSLLSSFRLVGPRHPAYGSLHSPMARIRQYRHRCLRKQDQRRHNQLRHPCRLNQQESRYRIQHADQQAF